MEEGVGARELGEGGAFSLLAPVLRDLLRERGFKEPTGPQVQAIPPLLAGRNLLLVAPTGSGKTEAAFLPILSQLSLEEERGQGIKLLYITPLRALNRDLLERLEWWCKRLDLRLAVRHGDTDARERSAQRLSPPDILITTPETLQALLPGRIMKEHLKALRWIIVDEVHELAEDRRGSQLSLALERLRSLLGREDLIIVGLSATIGTPDRVANYLVGEGRACDVVKVSIAKSMRFEVLYPDATEEDLELASRLFTFPEVAARLRTIKELLDRHKGVLIFTNTRSEAEVLASRFRLWEPDFPLAIHHGSLSKPTRLQAERDLKEGRIKGVICTSSLELGIDVGLLELVIQYNSPRQVTRLIQRVGRSGHRLTEISRGVIITQDSDDALEALVIARKALREELEPVKIPRKPLDVLTHQLAGLLLSKGEWDLGEALRLIRRAHPYSNLSEEELLAVLEYMHERYPRFALLNKERVGFSKGQSQALYRYYFEKLSMIPEERQYLVVDEEGEPIGVLDEAFVAEHGELGTKFTLAGAIWRIKEVSSRQIVVEREEDPTGAIPSWVGDEIPVPFEVAMEVGSIRRRCEEHLRAGGSLEELSLALSQDYPASPSIIKKALREVEESLRAGLPIPSDKKITVEKWREFIILQACFGHLINRTLARILGHRLSERLGVPVPIHQDPYRIILEAPEASPEELAALLKELAQGDLESLAREALARTGLFRRRFLHVAKRFGAIAKDADISGVSLSNLLEAFKGTIVYEEALRSALEDDADLGGTREVLRRMASGELEIVALEREELSPIARIGMEELARRSDIIPPDRMRRVILESARARLMNEARVVVCTKCWRFVEILKIRQLIDWLECPLCASRSLGLSDGEEEIVREVARRCRLGMEPTKAQRFLHKRLLRSARLVEAYGAAALLVLAARIPSIKEGEELLKRVDGGITDALIEEILKEERRALRLVLR